MRQFAIVAGFTLCLLPVAHAGDEGLAGAWKVTLIEKANPVEMKQMTFWLLRLEVKGGKLVGTADSSPGVPPTTVEDVSTTGDVLSFKLNLKGGPTFQFEGKLPRAGAKKFSGTIGRSGQMLLAVLEATSAKSMYDLERELVARTPNDPRVFSTVLELIAQAKEKKPAAKEVEEWAETAMRAAENYGARWQLDFSLKLVDTLQSQGDYAAAAIGVARKVEKGLDSKTPAETQLRVLSSLSAALRAAAGKADKPSEEVNQIEARIDKLESQSYGEYNAKALGFKVEKFAGRKGKSTRAVLVELFTGAQCPPCVAADLAFDALEKAYQPSEVVLFQYHLHIPGPDALTNDDCEARQNYYGKAVRGTPTIFFNGLPDAPGGGGRDDAEEKFKEFKDVVNPLLEKAAGVNIQASAVRKGQTIQIKAQVDGLEKPGDRIKLRFALVEDWARYRGSNGLAYHHRVVRAMVGGAKGFALTKKDSEHTASIELNTLREQLNRYLDDFAKSEGPFPDAQRPLRLRNLSVVAFVQNDDTREVLQAVNVEVKGD